MKCWRYDPFSCVYTCTTTSLSFFNYHYLVLQEKSNICVKFIIYNYGERFSNYSSANMAGLTYTIPHHNFRNDELYLGASPPNPQIFLFLYQIEW